jgi:hypothetical protein
VQKGQLSARWARKRAAISGPPQEHAFHWPYHYCLQMNAAGTKESRRPLTVVLFEGLCVCSGVAPAALRDSNGDAAAAAASLLLLLRWYHVHAWYHGMSRTGLPAALCLSAGRSSVWLQRETCRDMTRRRITASAVSRCTLSASLPWASTGSCYRCGRVLCTNVPFPRYSSWRVMHPLCRRC